MMHSELEIPFILWDLYFYLLLCTCVCTVHPHAERVLQFLFSDCVILSRIECKKVWSCSTLFATTNGLQTRPLFSFWTRKISLKRRLRSRLSLSASRSILVRRQCICRLMCLVCDVIAVSLQLYVENKCCNVQFIIFTKWTEWMVEILFSFDVCLCVFVSVHSGLVSQTSVKQLKLQTSNFTCIFPVTVWTWSLKDFLKTGHL